jgi:hypothetical protein
MRVYGFDSRAASFGQQWIGDAVGKAAIGFVLDPDKLERQLFGE